MKDENKKKEREGKWHASTIRAFLLAFCCIGIILGSTFFLLSERDREKTLPFIIGMFVTIGVTEAVTVTEYFQSRIKKRLLAFNKNKAEESALSISYLNDTMRNNRKVRATLFLGIAIFCFLDWMFSQINPLTLPLLFLILLSLLFIKEQLIEYRIRKGLFGTNRTEARALIDFIIKNSDDIDFNDSNGNLRRALLPEAETDTAEQTVPSFGEEVSA
ncbi:hypothetical protein KKHLCK_15135 [Candidatus Electrothrix laxa]